MIVGLTGGIASGKSTVTGMLRNDGAYVVDADIWARRVVEPGSEGLSELCAAFGDGILAEDGRLNRPALAAIVFQDAQARAQLNSITHPRVRAGMAAETKSFLAAHPDEPIVWDVPLLFEGDTHKLVDVTVLVFVDEATQLSRLMARDGLSQADAHRRIAAQMPIADKRRLADYIIDNTQSLDQTREQVQTLWQALRSRTPRGGTPSY